MITLSSSNAIFWNTSRSYTEHGQRMAALSLGDGVWMVDVDRGIDYYLPGCALDSRSVMYRYDGNVATSDAFKLVGEDYYPLRNQLEAIARNQAI